MVGGRISVSLIEVQTANRRAIRRRAVFARDHIHTMLVGIIRRDRCMRRIQTGTQVETGALETRLWIDALVAGPAEVQTRLCGVGDTVDFLPVTPADIADPGLVG